MSSQEQEGLLRRILLPAHHHFISIWMNLARPKEKQGLRVVGDVFEGCTQSMNPSTPVDDDIDRQWKTASQRVHRKRVTSTYTSLVCDPPKYYIDHSVLNFKKLHELPQSSVLEPEVVKLLQKWIDQFASETNKHELIDMLRSLYSTITIARPPISDFRRTFVWSAPSEIVSPRSDRHLRTTAGLPRLNLSKCRPTAATAATAATARCESNQHGTAGSHASSDNRPHTSRSMAHKEKGLDLSITNQFSKPLQPMPPQDVQTLRDRKKQFQKSTVPLNWIGSSSITHVTSYAHHFRQRPYQPVKPLQFDHWTSAATNKTVPDPFELSRYQDKLQPLRFDETRNILF
eukprot:GILK01002710.1.p1 GENE.GILK01002710.1~~GILK01002710.1.p1  ORF type:complete len:360 (+),score=49.28 GILK01002710.1:46-1080(+)